MSIRLKKRGFVLFEYSHREAIVLEGCKSMKELKNRHYLHLDDKWDVDGRHKIHYFYLNINTGKYKPLERWKNNFDPSRAYDQCELTSISNTF